MTSQCEAVAERLALGDVVGARIDRVRGGRVGLGVAPAGPPAEQLPPEPPPAQVAQALGRDDPQEPGRRGRRIAEISDRLAGPRERVLDRLLRLRAVTEQVVRDAVTLARRGGGQLGEEAAPGIRS